MPTKRFLIQKFVAQKWMNRFDLIAFNNIHEEKRPFLHKKWNVLIYTFCRFNLQIEEEKERERESGGGYYKTTNENLKKKKQNFNVNTPVEQDTDGEREKRVSLINHFHLFEHYRCARCTLTLTSTCMMLISLNVKCKKKSTHFRAFSPNHHQRGALACSFGPQCALAIVFCTRTNHTNEIRIRELRWRNADGIFMVPSYCVVRSIWPWIWIRWGHFFGSFSIGVALFLVYAQCSAAAAVAASRKSCHCSRTLAAHHISRLMITQLIYPRGHSHLRLPSPFLSQQNSL